MIGRFAKLGVHRQLLRSRDFYRVVFAGALAVGSYVWDRGSDGASDVGVGLAVAAVALNGIPIIWGAVKGLMQLRANVDELVSLAIIASVLQGEYLTAAVVSLVMMLGALIEEITSDSARRAIQALVNVMPDTATVIDNGEQRTVAVAEIKVGDVLLVKPGERIPADGLIAKGVAAIDESSMTGEPIPREKAPGESVYAGTLDLSGLLEIEATSVGSDTTLGRVIELVSDAEAHRPEAIKLIDRYARWFTPTILACAGLTWAVTGETSRAVAVLIVGCPCALILAAPTAVVAAIGRAARSGILIKGGLYLEAVARANAVLFDKTGTLTEGKPTVDGLVAVDGFDEREVLALAAAVEQNSTHPLARAVLDAAANENISLQPAEDMTAEIGLGVRARVGGRLVEVGSTYIGGGSVNVPDELRRHLESFKQNGATPLAVYVDRRPVGLISVADHVRPGARRCIEELRSLGVEHIGILSGDHEQSVARIAGASGVDEIWWQLNPEAKLNVIRDLQAAGSTTLFVGDGINDAPALAVANCGIAMGAAGTDVALETADVVLMHDDISKLPFLIRLSRRMLRTIKLNIVFGMVFNAVAVLAGGSGLLTPIMGAMVHNIGSVLVVLSSASIALAAEDTGKRAVRPIAEREP